MSALGRDCRDLERPLIQDKSVIQLTLFRRARFRAGHARIDDRSGSLQRKFRLEPHQSMTTIRRNVVAVSAELGSVPTAALPGGGEVAQIHCGPGVRRRRSMPRTAAGRVASPQGHNWRMHSMPSLMRAALLPAILTLLSGSAAAGWVEVGGNEVAVAYADSGTIRRAGNVVKMWHLIDYATARSAEGIKPYLSIKMQDEYDCAQQRARSLSVYLHSGNMGEGEVLGRVTDPGDWQPVQPDTLVETLRAFACGKW